MILAARYVIAVQDLGRSSTFYRDVLGFEILEIGDPGWRFFRRGGCCIMAGECPDAVSSFELGDHSYFAYWVVEDVDRYYAFVQRNGAEILKDVRDEPWGMREFALRTVDGHRVMVGTDLDA